MYYIGLDIGGTKCAASVALVEDGTVKLVEKSVFPTPKGEPFVALRLLSEIIAPWAARYAARGIGISCGGPLDSKRGLILSPPNLPGWDGIDIVGYFREKFGIPTTLCNDANACALAEWKFGAGRGTQNMIYLTFGTGFGAGLILDGKLYAGQNDMAGEAGHIRMSYRGGVGYGKVGSLESFCSGGGIAQLGQAAVARALERGETPALLAAAGSPDGITAKLIAELAYKGDRMCLRIYRKSGEMLGKGLALLIDLLNPEKIVIGGIFMRSADLLTESMNRQIEKEALPIARKGCKIVPAELSENVGDFAAITVAMTSDENGNP